MNPAVPLPRAETSISGAGFALGVALGLLALAAASAARDRRQAGELETGERRARRELAQVDADRQELRRDRQELEEDLQKLLAAEIVEPPPQVFPKSSPATSSAEEPPCEPCD